MAFALLWGQSKHLNLPGIWTYQSFFNKEKLFLLEHDERLNLSSINLPGLDCKFSKEKKLLDASVATGR